MDAMGLLTDTRERMSQHTVFGEPITHEGIVVIPVARIGGMAGAGTGNRSDTGTSEGAGKSERGDGAGFRGHVSGSSSFRGQRSVGERAAIKHRPLLQLKYHSAIDFIATVYSGGLRQRKKRARGRAVGGEGLPGNEAIQRIAEAERLE